MILSDDEIILQIRKGNKEALKLLFLYYEIHFKTLENKLRINLKLYGFDREDLMSIMMADMIDIIKDYDMEKSSFFVYWKVVEYRNLLAIYRKHYKEMIIQKKQVDIENEIFKSLINHNFDNPINDYILFEDYNNQLEFIDGEYGALAKKILILWSQGLKYREISSVLNIKISKVSYILNKCLNFLKGKIK